MVILSGSGQLHLAGEITAFGPDSTLIVPVDAVHQLVNTGSEPLTLVAALGPAPVLVTTEDGTAILLPWQDDPGSVVTPSPTDGNLSRPA